MSIKGHEPESSKTPYVCPGETLWSRNEGTLNARVTRTVISCIKETLALGDMERILSPRLATQISRSIEALDAVEEREEAVSDLDLLTEFLLVLQDAKSTPTRMSESYEALPATLQRVMIEWVGTAYPDEEPISFLANNPRTLLALVDRQGNNVIECLIEAAHNQRDYDGEPPLGLRIDPQLILQRQQAQEAFYSQLARSIVADRFPEQMQGLFTELKGLNDRRLIREIAKDCARRDLGQFLKRVELFPLFYEEDRVQLACDCLSYDPVEVLNHFRRFHITHPQMVFEVGKRLVKIEPTAVHNIEKLNLTNEEMQLELHRLAALYHPVSVTTLINTSGVPLDETMRPIALLAYAGTMLMGDVLEPENYFMVLKELEPFGDHHLFRRFFPQGIDQPKGGEDWKDIGLLYLLFKLAPNELEPHSVIDEAVQEIEKYDRPQLMSYLYKCLLLEILPNHIGTLRNLKKGLKPYLILPLIPVAAWQANSQIDASRLNEFLKPKRINKPFHDSKLMQAWLLAVESIDRGSILSPDRKLSLILQLTENLDQDKPIVDLMTRLGCLHTLPASLLDRNFTANMTQELNMLGEESIKTDPFLDVQEIDHFEDKYSRTFAVSGDPNAWRVYMKSLKKVETAAIRTAFNIFFREALEGTLEKTRYERQDPHTLRIKEAHGKLWEKWQSLPRPREVSLSTTPEAVSFLFRNQLLNHWKAGHTQDSAGGERLQKLNDYFCQPTRAAEIIRVCSLSRENPLNEIESDLIHLCELKSSDPVDVVTLLRKILLNRSALGSLEIVHDLEDMLTTYGGLVAKKRRVIVEETDRWQQILVCGVGLGSCLRVDGAGKYTQALLGYLLEGKNHLLVISDAETGKMLARSVLRVMWDSSNQRPALLQEKLYPDPRPAAFEHAINELAKERARQLGCRLYVAEPREDTSLTGVTIESLGGIAPDYSDASDGVSRDGAFEISGLYRVNLLTS